MKPYATDEQRAQAKLSETKGVSSMSFEIEHAAKADIPPRVIRPYRKRSKYDPILGALKASADKCIVVIPEPGTMIPRGMQSGLCGRAKVRKMKIRTRALDDRLWVWMV